MDQAVTDMLNADHNVQRAYHHPLGDTIFVYIGYYGAEGGWFTSGIARVERAESHRFEVFA